MKKVWLILVLLIASLVLLVGCDATNPAVVRDSPPINVVGAITQNVIADSHNSSVANVNAGETFTGTSTSTLGVAGIQVSLKTNQDCTVYVDQSPTDGVSPDWDITDTYSYISSKGGNSWTTQAVNSYVRVRVKNTSTSNTTYFRLQTALCPVVEAVPRSLNENGRFITDATLSDDYGFSVSDTPMGEMRVVTPVKLVGTTFVGTTLDLNFWLTTGTANGGTVTQANGQVTLATNTTANGAAELSSIRRGRYIAGSSMRYRAIAQLDVGLTDNKRRWGVGDWVTLPTLVDGAFFQLDGTTFSVVTLKGGTPTVVSSGSFNGNFGATYTLNTNAHTYEIYWTNSKVYFVIDGTLLHLVAANTDTWTNTVSFYIGCDNINSNNLDVNKTLKIRVMSIARLGQLQSAPIYKHITTAATTICKYGAGTLHSIIVGTPANQIITIFDNTTNSGTIMSVITLGNNTSPIELHYDMDFYTGLTIVNSGTIDATLVYE
jgi:hypothetical protein